VLCVYLNTKPLYFAPLPVRLTELFEATHNRTNRK